MVGCFDDGTTEVQYEFDAEEIMHVDFERSEVVYTVPRFLIINPSQAFQSLQVYNNAVKAKNTCPAILSFWLIEEKPLPEDEGKDFYPCVNVTL